MTSKNMRIGLDFDNTIVCYDRAISVLAEQKLDLPPELPRTKLALRDFLRASGREQEWSAFQGELYGPGMNLAQPFTGAIETMQELLMQGHELTIVSHRSRRPYVGPSYDLHEAALCWIRHRLQTAGLFKAEAVDTHSRPLNFLETREAKVAMIGELDCQIFVDDLPEVLTAPGFPGRTVGVLFAPNDRSSSEMVKYQIAAWRQLPGLLAELW